MECEHLNEITMKLRETEENIYKKALLRDRKFKEITSREKIKDLRDNHKPHDDKNLCKIITKRSTLKRKGSRTKTQEDIAKYNHATESGS